MKKIVSFIIILIFLLSFSACSSNEKPLKIVSITDIHFTGSEYFSYVGTFLSANDSNGTGKQVKYIEPILDAFIQQMLEEKPDCILISGDLALDGAKVSHLALAEKLSQLTENGISVLVLPGNHDITGYTFTFPDGEPETVESVSAEEFAEIYSTCGYSNAISYDSESLSYVYDTEKGVRIFMLDTNLHYGATLGKISQKTISWLRDELIKCNEAGDVPIVSGHHSLLSHNPRFDFGYKLANGAEVESIITEYGASLYLCGHLHTQHFAESEKLTDVVGGGFCVYPHRYGVIEVTPEGWTYESKTTDVEKYAKEIGITDENLLDYSEYGYDFFYKNAYEQAKAAIFSVVDDPELAEKYSVFSAKLNVAYFGGTFSDVDLSFTEEFLAAAEDTGWGSYIKSLLADTNDSISCQRP